MRRPDQLDNQYGPLIWDKPSEPTLEEIAQSTPGFTDKDVADLAAEITQEKQ